VLNVWLGRAGCHCEIEEGQVLQLPKLPAVWSSQMRAWLITWQPAVRENGWMDGWMSGRARSSFQLLILTTRRSIVTKSTIKIIRRTPDDWRDAGTKMMFCTEYSGYRRPRNKARNVLVCHLFVSGESLCLSVCLSLFKIKYVLVTIARNLLVEYYRHLQ
jgi:hypothetical protein